MKKCEKMSENVRHIRSCEICVRSQFGNPRKVNFTTNLETVATEKRKFTRKCQFVAVITIKGWDKLIVNFMPAYSI